MKKKLTKAQIEHIQYLLKHGASEHFLAKMHKITPAQILGLTK